MFTIVVIISILLSLKSFFIQLLSEHVMICTSQNDELIKSFKNIAMRMHKQVDNCGQNPSGKLGKS